MKKRMFFLVTVIFAAASIFAAGNLEDSQNGNGRGNCPKKERPAECPRGEKPEVKTITGKVVIEEAKLPVLKVDGATYLLMVRPGFLEDKLVNGEEISVEGIVMRGQWAGNIAIIRPFKITKGEEVIEIPRHKPGKRGGHHGKPGKRQGNDGCRNKQDCPYSNEQ